MAGLLGSATSSWKVLIYKGKCQKRVSIQCTQILLHSYRNYLNRSRPCIILDSKFPRLVLDVFQEL